MEPYLPLSIYPYNIISKITRSHLYPLPNFLQWGKHSKLETIHALSIPKLSLNGTTYSSMVPHELNSILTNFGGEYIVSRVFMADAIFEVSQYNFDMEKLTVHPKYVTPPKNESKSENIMGI